MTATSQFVYDLPPAAIAQSAIEPRHDARLLDARTMADHRFRDLPDLLAPGDIVVVNRTRVRPARLLGTKESGGSVEVLLLGRTGDRWEALARPARRMRRGTLLQFGEATARLVDDPRDGLVVLESEADLAEVAEQTGEIPLPPYFHGTLTDTERYQTMFADSPGSAAAPTAGLHFTESVTTALEVRGIEIARIDLEVGIDTFRPIAAEELEDHTMHSERFVVAPEEASRINAARNRGGRVVAVGTTVVRTLETVAVAGEIEPGAGATDLFIRPGHRFQAVDLLVTNFHVPGSSLVVLVAAVLGERWRRVYESALERGYRFLSFGDAMLAEVGR